jgi:hypothetical protein
LPHPAERSGRHDRGRRRSGKAGSRGASGDASPRHVMMNAAGIQASNQIGLAGRTLKERT